MSVPGPAALVPAEQCHATEPFAAFLDDFDVQLTPTCGILPPPATDAPWHLISEQSAEGLMAVARFVQAFNLSGEPALSLPVAWTSDGTPVGVQLAGRYLEESFILRLAAQLDEAMPWSGRVPPQFAWPCHCFRAGPRRTHLPATHARPTARGTRQVSEHWPVAVALGHE
jgi:amidase